MDCSEAKTLFSDHLDGRVPEPQRAALEAHVAECPACAAHLAELRATMALLDDAYAGMAVDADALASRVAQTARRSETTPPKRRPVLAVGARGLDRETEKNYQRQDRCTGKNRRHMRLLAGLQGVVIEAVKDRLAIRCVQGWS